jgi:hypothetical protein
MHHRLRQGLVLSANDLTGDVTQLFAALLSGSQDGQER